MARRDWLMLLAEVTKAGVVGLTLARLVPYPTAWAHFARGNMDIIMLVLIKPLAEQVRSHEGPLA